ncbi:MAG TPA: ATP-binding protein [Streptosporangiaceae bacterium]|nr:ATP-binding protein [Streptosporangiaceae bacterium]
MDTVTSSNTSRDGSPPGGQDADLRSLLEALRAVRDGDFRPRFVPTTGGTLTEIGEVLAQILDRNQQLADELLRVSRQVMREGRLDERLAASPGQGGWTTSVESANALLDSITTPLMNTAKVLEAVADGDLAQRADLEIANRPLRGDLRRAGKAVNRMVDQLSLFTTEVTRVAGELGTEGRLGGRSRARGLTGGWARASEAVNDMAARLTAQVRDIALVTTAIAKGDLTRKVTAEATGEMLELKVTVNTMVDQLSAFAGEVTRVAREVGTEGVLGGQARVPGAEGVWKDLTDHVNLLAANLTTQVRAIAEVAGAVAHGDLTRAISVDVSGEVAELKDNVNLMVANLRETTRAKDWLETNLARIAGLMQGHRDLVEVASLILSELTPMVNAQYGAFFLDQQTKETTPRLRLIAGYGYQGDERLGAEIAHGQGLVGQAAVTKQRIIITEAPPEYIKISSGLGEASPSNIVVLPIVFEDHVLGVIELASFSRFSDVHLAFFDQFVHTIGAAINAIIANSRTESLLAESQRRAERLGERSEELRHHEAELRRSTAEMEEKAALLVARNREIEVRNAEIEQARRALEERAEQLALSSRYTSNFLANMSHELRTPLNSLLLPAKLMWANPDGNLTPEQVESARTIYGAGRDLLRLIDDILDLAKVEAGKTEIHQEELQVAKLVDYVNATFRHLAVEKGLDFEVIVADDVPVTLATDEPRLRQIIRNLLSNAIKFTSEGAVALVVHTANDIAFTREGLRAADQIVAFSVSDTGAGIGGDKLKMIFDSFQQADGTTSREYGGTGRGLSICRDIAELLGGEIRAESRPGMGSTFTLYLPDRPGPGLEEPGMVIAEDMAFVGKKVLIVDEDIRSVFALSTVLERSGLTVLYAGDGKRGIETLEQNDDVALVFMDVMMPEMDGYATTRAIRRMPRFADLPIVALTAKAMKGDQEESLAAGMSDYVTKPVEIEYLFSVMRRWLDAETDK